MARDCLAAGSGLLGVVATARSPNVYGSNNRPLTKNDCRAITGCGRARDIRGKLAASNVVHVLGSSELVHTRDTRPGFRTVARVIRGPGTWAGSNAALTSN